MTITDRTVVFPSRAYFEALAAAARADPDRYRRLGTTDVVLAVRIGDAEVYRLVFEDYECIEVTTWDGIAAVDCVLSAELEDWCELVDHLRTREPADASHTLNSLVLSDERFHITGETQLGIDKFYRYNATLQSYFEETSDLGVKTR